MKRSKPERGGWGKSIFDRKRHGCEQRRPEIGLTRVVRGERAVTVIIKMAMAETASPAG